MHADLVTGREQVRMRARPFKTAGLTSDPATSHAAEATAHQFALALHGKFSARSIICRHSAVPPCRVRSPELLRTCLPPIPAVGHDLPIADDGFEAGQTGGLWSSGHAPQVGGSLLITHSLNECFSVGPRQLAPDRTGHDAARLQSALPYSRSSCPLTQTRSHRLPPASPKSDCARSPPASRFSGSSAC